jgi:hypothetical protein
MEIKIKNIKRNLYFKEIWGNGRSRLVKLRFLVGIFHLGTNELLTGKGHILPFTFTQMPGGKKSSCSQDVSSRQNLICTCGM